MAVDIIWKMIPRPFTTLLLEYLNLESNYRPLCTQTMNHPSIVYYFLYLFYIIQKYEHCFNMASSETRNIHLVNVCDLNKLDILMTN